MKYRLYIDEVGNSDMNSSTDPNHRYLSLTGVVIDLDHVKQVVYTELEALKARFFSSHPDEPISLHRRELVRRLFPFQALNDPETRQRFDEALLALLIKWEYRVISVVIDKQEHQARYTVWKYHPYHYCMHVLLERYVMFLEGEQLFVDVMVEARGGKEDTKLKESFTRVWEHGTDHIKSKRFQSRFTSREIKLKQKTNNIAGLQIADLIAHPSFRAMRQQRSGETPSLDFGTQIVQILKNGKYLQSTSGKIDGWGRKWLP